MLAKLVAARLLQLDDERLAGEGEPLTDAEEQRTVAPVQTAVAREQLTVVCNSLAVGTPPAGR